MKAFNVKELYQESITSSSDLLPSPTMDFWTGVYTGADKAVIDREFARRFSGFIYYDFMGADTATDSLTNFKADVTSILTFNKKRYEEMYRVFLVEDDDDPITYNYDMTETTGKQHTETVYGESQFTKGEQENTNGEVKDSHNVAPYNSLTATMPESEDITSENTYTDGERTDTTAEHSDNVTSDEWTLTRKGNIGVQTAGDILRIHTDYWTEKYKFLQLIFDDISKQLLFAEV